jgi:hypothetical protein
VRRSTKGNSTKFSMEAAISSMGAKGGDRGPSTRSRRARGTREETTIRISRARAFIREVRVAVTRAERDPARWPGIRAVEMVVVADTDHLSVSYVLTFLLINLIVYYSP